MADINDDGGAQIIAQMSENYLNNVLSPQAQLTRAQIPVVQQQAQGLNIANQRNAIGLALYKHVLTNFSGQQAQGTPDDSTQSGAFDSDQSGETSSAPRAPAPSTMALASSGAPGADTQVAGSQSGQAAAPGADTQVAGSQSGQAAAAAAAAAPQQAADEDTVDSGFPDGFNPVEARQLFWVNPAGTPRERAMMLEAAFSGDPGLLQYAKAQRDLGVQSRTAEAQKHANDAYDTFGLVTDPTDKHPLTMLGRFAPALAAKIERKYANDPQAADDAARAAAAHVQAMLHQFTGRPVVARKDGTYVDRITGMPIPGVPISGMSQQQYAGLSAKGEALVSVPQSDGSQKQEPQWMADRAPNLAAWVSQQASHGAVRQAIGNAPLVPGGPLGRQVPSMPPAVVPALMAQHRALGQQLQQVQTGAQRQQMGPNGQPVPVPNQQPAPVNPATLAALHQQIGNHLQQLQQQQVSGNPLLADNQVNQQAFSDPDYKVQQPRVISGVSQAPAALDMQKKMNTARIALGQEISTRTTSAANSLTYLNAAQAVMNSPGRPPVGMGAGAAAAVSRALQAVGGSGNYATRHAEIEKYLMNNAVQGLKQTFASSRVAAQEVQLAISKLNPSTGMTPDAVRNLIGEISRIAKYNIAAAQLAPAYLRKGGDPTLYEPWLQKFYPMSRFVNQKQSANASTAASSGAAGGKLPLMDASGWRLMTDAQGRQAYVSPDGKQFARAQ